MDEQGRPRNSVASTRSVLRKLLATYPDKTFTELTYDDLVSYVNSLPETRRGTQASSIRGFFKWGMLVERLEKDPARLMPSQKWRISGPIQDLFSEDEIATLEGLPEPDGTLMALMFETGLAKIEAQNLRVKDFDLPNWHMHVAREAKAAPLPRIVPLEEALVKRLQRHFRVFDLGRDDYLWATRPGGGRLRRDKPMSAASFQNWWKDTLAEGGVPHRPIKQARHTCATRWVNRGKRLDDIQLILGHNSYYTTQALYAPVRFANVEKRFRQELPPEVAEGIARYEWRVAYAPNHDGTFTLILLDKDGITLKWARGTDFHDAILDAWKDVFPPSSEVLREQQSDDS